MWNAQLEQPINATDTRRKPAVHGAEVQGMAAVVTGPFASYAPIPSFGNLFERLSPSSITLTFGVSLWIRVFRWMYISHSLLCPRHQA